MDNLIQEFILRNFTGPSEQINLLQKFVNVYVVLVCRIRITAKADTPLIDGYSLCRWSSVAVVNVIAISL